MKTKETAESNAVPSEKDRMPAVDRSTSSEVHGISPQDPSSMPRAEDDAIVFEKSPEFHDRKAPAGTTKNDTDGVL